MFLKVYRCIPLIAATRAEGGLVWNGVDLPSSYLDDFFKFTVFLEITPKWYIVVDIFIVLVVFLLLIQKLGPIQVINS